jgi:hypothetical protein
LVFTANLVWAARQLLKSRLGVFNYLLSGIFILGFFVKFSVHELLRSGYHEPVGTFTFGLENINNVLMVSTFGGLGFLFSQLVTGMLARDKRRLNKPAGSSFYKQYLIVGIAILMAVINIKYNILVSGLLPSIRIPLGGNAIFYLILTRGLMFLFLMYSAEKWSYHSLILGSILAGVSSFGVFSRMIMLLFFATIGIKIILNFLKDRFATNMLRIASFAVVFGLVSIATVKYSTEVRSMYYRENVQVESKNYKKPASVEEKKVGQKTYFQPSLFETYSKLVIDRWIGLEGVMAVQSYKDQGFSLLLEAFKEKGYNGMSFYTKISEPNKYLNNERTGSAISTSVPGPVAFAYYSGSKLFVLAFMFITVTLCNLLIRWVDSMLLSETTIIYISVFMVLDYFQFGISPIAFMKYWIFTFVSIFLFIFREKIFSYLAFWKQV